MKVTRVLLVAASLFLSFFLWQYFRTSKVPPRPSQNKREQPNLLFITIDTLRPDHLGVYGYQKIQTPTIDALAREGVLFKDAICQTPLTLVSHSSMFTGLDPNVHGVRDNAYIVLDDSYSTLAELLKNAGYHTGAFIGSAVLERRYGLAQGFDTYSKFQPTSVVGSESQRKADEVVAEAENWLSKIKGKRYFLWLHLYDPHFPYSPPEPFHSQYQSPYDGEIAYTDQILGNFLEKLKTQNLLANTLILLLGDHGESLGEHREDDHGYFVYDSTLKIPFLLHWTGQIPAGKVITEQVQSIDVLPTIAELMGIKMDQPIQGKTLMPLLRGEHSYGQPYAYAESLTPKLYYGWSDLKCLRTGEWKYIDAPEPELYHLKSDPGELQNLAAKNPEKIRQFKERMKDFVKLTESRKQKEAVDAERMEQLAALGYVGMVNPSLQSESTIDPKSKIEDYRLVHKLVPEAVRLMNYGDYKGGRDRFKKVEARFPNSFMIYWYLGYCYANLGEPKAAEKAYVRSIQLNPIFGRGYTELALTLALLNRHADGIKILEQAPPTALSVADRELIQGEIYTNQGEFIQAEAAYNRALKADPEAAEARYGLARVYLATKKVDQAIETMQLLSDQKYPSEDVYDSLADLYQEMGAFASAERIYEQWLIVFPKSANVYYRFGQFLIRQGQQQRGSVLLRKAAELNPKIMGE